MEKIKKPTYGYRYCINCGSKIPIFHKKRLNTKEIYCNNACLSQYKQRNRNNTSCVVCGKHIYVKSSNISKNHGNCCSRKCADELKSKLYRNENNPNHINNIDLSCIYDITHNGAYILGLIWSDGHLEKNSVIITQNEKLSGDLLLMISYLLYGYDNRKHKINDVYTLSIHNKDFIEYLLSLKGINIGKKSDKIYFPDIPQEFHWSFICGYFDGDGCFAYNYRYPQISITSNSHSILKQISSIWNVNYTNKGSIYAYGCKAIDICGKMYKNVTLCHEKKYNYYISILNYEPRLPHQQHIIDTFKVCKLDKNAILPYKTRVTDTGYDISVIEMKEISKDIYMCDTKISVEPPPGYYFDVIGRSSLPKNNMHFIGGVGIIDKSYVGPIKLILQQIDTSLSLPELPFRCAQLIPRQFIHFEMVEVDKLENTERGYNGFGSTSIPSDIVNNKNMLKQYIKVN